MISLRLDEELHAAVDAAAEAAGVPRGQWIKDVLRRELGRKTPRPVLPKISKEGSVRVSLRLPLRLLKHIDRSAVALGLTRGQWLRRRAVGAWIQPPPEPPVMTELYKLNGLLARIGTNVNRASRAVHTAALNGDDGALTEAATVLGDIAEASWVHLDAAQAVIREVGSRGSDYWSR